MAVLPDPSPSPWDRVLDEYEDHLDRQSARLARLAVRPGDDADPADDDLDDDPGAFVPPADLPAPPSRVVARLVELRERTTLLHARGESAMRGLRSDRPARSGRLQAPRTVSSGLLDRQM